MSLFRLIYVSRVARQVRFTDAEDIARDAAENNRSRGITGMLVYSPSHFVQVLEGEESDVQAVVSRIRADPRHFEIRVLDARTVPAREFGAWAMTARRWSKREEVDPQRLTAEGALQILLDARSEAAT